jgi:hypothetical protein
MRDVVRNFITVLGTDAVKATHREVIRRLREHNGTDPFTHIGEVLYGLPPDKARLGKKETHADWVAFSFDYGDEDQLGIDSGRSTPNQLLNHIVWFYSKVDPKCVLCNTYDHESEEFLGGSFRLVNKQSIRNFERFRHISETPCSDEEMSEFDDSDAINRISWTDYWNIQDELIAEAKEMMLAEHPDREFLF